VCCLDRWSWNRHPVPSHVFHLIRGALAYRMLGALRRNAYPVN
jgi:hypothetical protein